MCWGDGFVTDPVLIQNLGLTDPKPFFNAVRTLIFLLNCMHVPTLACFSRPGGCNAHVECCVMHS
jgi:hypothetical protein